MKYWGPINSPGGINGNDPYVDGNPAAGIEGSIPTFHSFEQTLRGLQRLVARSQFTPDPATDDVQIAQAVRSQGLNYFVDTGTADAMVISTGGDPPLSVYSAGLPLHIKKVNSTNTTTAPTVQVDGLAAKVVVNADGSALAPGMIPALGLVVVIYDAGIDKFRLQNGVAGSSQTLLQNAAFPQKQIYNAAGVYTWVVPVGVTKCRVHVWGAGAGGGGGLGNAAGGSGGGAGGYAEKVCLVTPGTPITVTVGGGGFSGVNDTDGGSGGTSSFGAFCSATGGLRGTHAGSNLFPGQPAGTGGSGAGGDLNLSGTYGGCGGGDNDVDAEKWGGGGGMAPLGGGGGYVSTGTSGPGLWPGGGGSGGGGSAALNPPGGSGAAGGVIIEFVTPS